MRDRTIDFLGRRFYGAIFESPTEGNAVSLERSCGGNRVADVLFTDKDELVELVHKTVPKPGEKHGFSARLVSFTVQDEGPIFQ